MVKALKLGPCSKGLGRVPQNSLQQRHENVHSTPPLGNESLNVFAEKNRHHFSEGIHDKPLQLQEENGIQPVEIKCVWKTQSEVQ